MDVTRRRSGPTRDAIIEAATALIRVHGVAGTSIADVIAASGTSAGAIYHHFGSKERLVLEVARSAMAIPMQMVMDTATDLAPGDLLTAALDRLAEKRDLPGLLLQIWAGAASDPRLQLLLGGDAVTAKEMVVGFVGQWCSAHAPDTDPVELAEIILSLVVGSAVQGALGMAPDPGYRDAAARVLSAAIR